jgi:hypothetical protein
LIMLIIPLRAVAQQPTISIDAELKFKHDTVGPLDPIFSYIQIINSGDTTINIYPIIFYSKYNIDYGGNITIEYKKKSDRNWHKFTIKSKYLQFVHHNVMPFVTLNPGDSILSNNIEFSLSDFFNVVDEGDTYYFKVNSTGFMPYRYSTNCRISTLFIQKYQGDDSLIYNYVKTLLKPTFFYDYKYLGNPFIYENGKDEPSYPYLNESINIINRFPNSKFIPWFDLYLAIAYADIAKYHQVNHNKDLVLKYLEKSQIHNNKVISLRNNAEVKSLGNSLLGRYLEILEELYQGLDNIPYQILQTYFKNE